MSHGHTQRLESALAGRYKVEKKLGEGGMATVYLAEDIKHERKVALKILKPELAAVIGAERFLAEIKTTANLQHPHILPLFDSGEAEGFLYYVMPFIDGETLGEKLARDRQMGVDEAVRIARDVADALDYAHRNDVLHRDIKPGNILLHDGRPVVGEKGELTPEGGMSYDELNACRGRDKMEVFLEKIGTYRTDLAEESVRIVAQQAHDEVFVTKLLANLGYISEIEGTTNTFRFLKEHGVYVATGTGFPKVVADGINNALGWVREGIVDYATCKEIAGAGRPHPNMINDALRQAGILEAGADKGAIHAIDYSQMIKAGDTKKDVEEGLKVGATVIAVQTGTQDIEGIVADEFQGRGVIVLPSVADIPEYLLQHGFTFPR